MESKKGTALLIISMLLLVVMTLQLLVSMGLLHRSWRYRLEFIPDETFKERADAWGAGGWEAVSARRANGPENAVGYEIIFKAR